MFKLRIAQVCPFFSPVTGGVENHVFLLSKHLVRLGHDITVFTSNRDHQGKMIAPSRDCLQAIRVMRFPVSIKIGSFGNLWPSFVIPLRNENFDIIHTHLYRHPHSTLALLTAQSRRVPCVLTGHSPFHPTSVRGTAVGSLAIFYDALVGHMLTPRYDAVIAVSSSESQTYQKLGVQNKHIHYVPNGVSKEAFEKMEPGNFARPFFLYLGRLHPTKGLEFLIRSFAQLSKRRPFVDLNIVGDGAPEYKRQLSSLVQSLQMQDKIAFTGQVDEERKKQIISSCLCLVLPSVYEPFGIVVLEAMAQGKPVIATTLGGPRDIIEDGRTGYLVAYGDHETLAMRLETLLASQAKAREMGQRAQERSKLFLWDNIACQVESVYKKVLNA